MGNQPQGPRTILFVQEGGAGAGHLTRLVPFAHALHAYGYRPVFAVASPELAWPLTGAFPVLAIPPPPQPPIATAPSGPPFANLAAWLLAREFPSEAVALQRARVWDDIVRAIDPIAVVSDFSFSCLLVTAGRLPHIWLADGYLVPPRQGAGFVSYADDPPGVREPIESRLAEVLAAARRSRGWLALDGPYALVDDSLRLLLTLPELDPPRFRAARRERYCRPLAPPPPLAPPVPIDGSRKFLAYLSAGIGTGARVARLIEGLADAGVPGTLVFPGLTSPSAAELAKHDITLATAMVDYAEALPASSLVVHYGGVGTALAAILAGRPQLVVPAHDEHRTTADCVVAAGVGTRLDLDRLSPRSLTRLARGAIGDSALAERAHRLAEHVRRYDLADPVGEALRFLA